MYSRKIKKVLAGSSMQRSGHVLLFIAVGLCAVTSVFGQSSREVVVFEGARSEPLEFTGSDLSGMVSVSATDESFYLKVVFGSPKAVVEHKPWVWDESLNSYVVGDPLEDCVKIFLFDELSEKSFADVWVWRAARSGRAGYADDLSWHSSSSSEMNIARKDIYMDSGVTAWYSRFLNTFSGPVVQRFYTREPSGSCADVTVKASWSDGVWQVVFSRLRNTHNSDDLAFVRNGRYRVVVAVRDQADGMFKAADGVEFILNDKAEED